ncbi:Fc.00g113560.m01.CDS01 [Cosmosporella sp. VM-42]
MLDRLKDSVHKQAKRLSRHSVFNPHSESEQQSSTANNGHEISGKGGYSDHPAIHPLTAGPPAPRPATAQNPNSNPNPIHEREHAFEKSTEDFAEHPAIHPLTTEPSPRTPHFETPYSPLSSSAAPSHPNEDRGSTSSEIIAAIPHPPSSRPTIKNHKVPEGTISKKGWTLAREEYPYIPRKAVPQPNTEYTQLNGMRRWSNGSLVPDCKVPTEEQTHHNVSREKHAPVGGDVSSTSSRQDEEGLKASRYTQLNSKDEGPHDSLAHDCDICQDGQLHHKLSSGGEFCHHKYPALQSSDQGREALAVLEPTSQNLSTHVTKYDSVRKYDNVDFDHTAHNRPAVTHEEVKPHVHTIYEPHRTRSIHYHEHKDVIQPVIDPDPEILPEQHWAQDHNTGKVFRIPDELGKELSGI